jgi:hypothetical protein
MGHPPVGDSVGSRYGPPSSFPPDIVDAMSIFTTPPSQLKTSDLQALLDNGAVENTRLEFKLLIPNKDEILKKLSSFANTFGGLLVVGAKANSNDGRLEDLPGVDPESGYKQKVVQWSYDGASPPLVVQVSDPIPVPCGNGKVCYVIFVAESDVAPHFLHGRKGAWVRTDEYSAKSMSQLANETELRLLLDRRSLIRERRANLIARARNRFRAYAGVTSSLAAPNEIKLPPFLSLCLVPRFPSQPLCRQEKLRPLVTDTALNWRQTQFPDLGVPAISQHESVIMQNAAGTVSFFEVNIWGLLLYVVKIQSVNPSLLGIHLYAFVGYLLTFIRHSGQLLNELAYSGPLHIEIELSSIRGVPWLRQSEGGSASEGGSEFDDQISFSISNSLEDLLEKPDGIALEIIRYILFAVNMPHMVDTKSKLEEILRKGYEFNFWPRPQNLKI